MESSPDPYSENCAPLFVLYIVVETGEYRYRNSVIYSDVSLDSYRELLLFEVKKKNAVHVIVIFLNGK